MESIFISYSHRDIVEATIIRESLKTNGFKVWHDKKWLKPGDDFAVEITKAIRECTAFVLLLSPESNASDFVCKEVSIAYYFHKPIFPVFSKLCEISDSLLPYIIRLHYWDLNKNGAAEFAVQVKRKLNSMIREKTNNGSCGSTSASIICLEDINNPKSCNHLVTQIDFNEYINDPAFFEYSVKPHRSANEDNGAITYISWDEAIAYCDWANGCLPSDNVEPLPGETKLIEMGEWIDAGTEQHKHVRNCRTTSLIAVMDRHSRSKNIGFRCVAVSPIPDSRWININGGVYELGTDTHEFNHLAEIYHLRVDLRQSITNRHISQFRVRDFEISTTCITNEQYFKFTKNTGHIWPPYWHARWFSRSNFPFPARLASRPVTYISAENAQEYAMWVKARLPTWTEWECAASGISRRIYPWGDRYSTKLCNSIESEVGSLVSADGYPLGDTPEGVRQLCGNVSEWVVGPNGNFEIRGGSYRTPCELWGLTFAFRSEDPLSIFPDVGFRIITR
ncbi:MAG: SUMF1/EgtB/PvdO family nonheme iron enzyme [Dehalococcoidia bacterium]|nr:SUMF1/EgtB/PvdO family nonheme iron enzyme [Dehalococcoidia bacterium]MDD5494744.1 SUMF1/EgtB/PvdO family nonheme iron enzyme [Dehalococcoidia bacterium]